MALLDFIKEIQFYANQGTPVGEVLAKERLMESEMGLKQRQQQQQGQALASALPQELQGFADLVRTTGDVGTAIEMYKAQQPAAGKLTFDAYGNPIQVVIDQNGQPVAQRIGGLDYQQGGNLGALFNNIARTQQQPAFNASETEPDFIAPDANMPDVGLNTPLGVEPMQEEMTQEQVNAALNAQPQAEMQASQPSAAQQKIDRLMQVRLKAIETTPPKQLPQVLGQIDAYLSQAQKERDLELKQQEKQQSEQVTGSDKENFITNYQKVRDSRATIQRTIEDIKRNPTDAGYIGKAKGLLQTVTGTLQDATREVPGLSSITNRLPSVVASEGGYVSRFAPVQSELATGLAASRSVGKPLASQLEAAKSDVDISGASSEQVIEKLMSLDQQLGIGEQQILQTAKALNVPLDTRTLVKDAVNGNTQQPTKRISIMDLPE